MCKLASKMSPLISEGQNKAFHTQGSMAELAYATVSKTAVTFGVRVQIPLLLPPQTIVCKYEYGRSLSYGIYPLAIRACRLWKCNLRQSH